MILSEPRESTVPCKMVEVLTDKGYQLELVETVKGTQLYYCEKVDMYVQLSKNETLFKDAGDPMGPSLVWMGKIHKQLNA